MSVFLLPGIYKNYNELDYITETFRKRIDKAFEEKGYILASFVDTGFFYVFSKHRLTGLADLKEQKVLTWFGEVETSLYNELGINAAPIAIPEMVSAISTGLGNTALVPAAWLLGMQVYQYVNYYLKPAMLYAPAGVVVSAHIKDKLSKTFRISDIGSHNILEMFIYEIMTFERSWKDEARSFEAKCLKAFETRCGIKAVTLSPEDQKAFEQASIKVQEKLAGKLFPRELLDAINQALEEYRSQK